MPSTYVDTDRHSGTMLDMAKQRKPLSGKKEGGKPKPQRTGHSFTLWVPEDVEQELAAFLERTTPQPSKKAVFITALREFFARRKPPS